MERLVAMLSHEYQREVAARSGALPGRKPRPDPPSFVDLEQYAGLSHEHVARVLGATGDQVEHLAEWVAENRAGLYDRRDAPGQARCEAGVKQWGLLRCHRRAIGGERWCRQHHPAPPPAAPPPTRLHPWDLGMRPDGALLSAIYELTDQQRHLGQLIEAVLDRLDRAEARREDPAPDLLNVAQASELLGVSRRTVYTMCKSHRIPWLRLQGQYRFRARDLEKWLTDRTIRPVR